MSDDGPFDRHAPEGFHIAIQFWQGETEDQAIRETAEYCKLPPDAVVAVSGHYHYEWEGGKRVTCEFRPYGWMVFVRHNL